MALYSHCNSILAYSTTHSYKCLFFFTNINLHLFHCVNSSSKISKFSTLKSFAKITNFILYDDIFHLTKNTHDSLFCGSAQNNHLGIFLYNVVMIYLPRQCFTTIFFLNFHFYCYRIPLLIEKSLSIFNNFTGLVNCRPFNKEGICILFNIH